MRKFRSPLIATALLWIGFWGGLSANLNGASPGSQLIPKAERVVLIVWDGMRPDFVTPTNTPNLCRLAAEGVFFKAHHSVYVSSTEVNGTALATGAYPKHSGIIANTLYLPALNLLEPVATESIDTIRRSDILAGGHYLKAPTIAERVQQAGFRTLVAGSKPVAVLQDRARKRVSGAAQQSVMLYAGHSIPSKILSEIVKNNGKDFPASFTPNVPRDEWTTKALTETLWKRGVPKFSVLWLSEPDASQHASSPGSTNALTALASDDRNLGRVLDALERHGLRESTDLFVVSDHAFSTVQEGVDVAETLKKAGISASRKFIDPEAGQVLVLGLGGSVFFYVVEHDPGTARKVVEVLQKSEFAGTLFSRSPVLGTFPLAEGMLDRGTDEPDVVMSMRWSSQTNQFGAPGLVLGDTLTKGTGSHGSLSPYDLHNTLIACGPDFRKGWVDELPSGNADLAPTILWILGIKPSPPLDGRVLREAFVGSQDPAAKPQLKVIQAVAEMQNGRWVQYLKSLTFEGRTYFDEGNGGVETQ